MTHLERYMSSIRRKPFDRIPFTMGMSGPCAARLTEYTGVEYGRLLFDVFGVDKRWAGPRYVGPHRPCAEEGCYKTMFGVTMRKAECSGGSYDTAVAFPLAGAATADEVRGHDWPKAADHDFGPMLEAFDRHPDYPFMAGYHALGWFSWDMRGMDLFLEDLILNPTIADAVIESVAEFGYAYFKALFEAAKPYLGGCFTTIQLADDWGTQRGLLIGVDTFRRHFKRHYSRMIDLAHKNGVLVEFHCCGSQGPLIPEFIDLGVDILNPLQTSAAGMTPHILKKEFGDHIAFSGGVDVQTVLPNGTVASVRDEVMYLLDSVGKGGGYVLEPSHSIQADTPPENVVAMVDAIYEYYGMAKTGLNDR
ncbi:MAG: hypothetical protein FWE70_02420 [Oscillospiraceae bacterium]|nr:hypothetical protein [Oscillospiraceae bacterium]